MRKARESSSQGVSLLKRSSTRSSCRTATSVLSMNVEYAARKLFRA